MLSPGAAAAPAANVGGVQWSGDELRRAFRAFHKYGTEFDKASKMVGGGKAPDLCEALFRRHQAYLSLDKKFQSEVAFVAMVQDAANEDGGGGDVDGGGDDGAGAAPGPLLKPREPSDDEATEDDDGGDGGDEHASPGRGPPGATLASTRARRTPKRPGALSPSAPPPPSSGKRARGGRAAEGDIYEYYDDAGAGGGGSESARKRRAAAKRLDYEVYQPQPTRRRGEAAAEQRGIDALLALAADLGDDGGDGGGGGGGGGAPPRSAPRPAPRAVEEEEEDEDDGLADAGAAAGDDGDEDYRGEGARGGRGAYARRTPGITPAKGRRPGSSHLTPRRSAGRAGLASPGLRGLASPAWLDAGDSLGLGDLDAHGMGLLPSPAFGGLSAALPSGFVPSPQNPMPRLRRRKHAPEKTAPMISPIKSLFGRRASLGGASSLVTIATLGFGAAAREREREEEAAAGPMTPAEARLRHALNARVRKWAQFEFFYSAIDRPWFMASPVADLLAHLGLAGVQRMTRVEWNCARAGLGRPRRLSLRFLREERARLEKWRESVRAHHLGDPTAADAAVTALMPRPLGVGQRVIARHPLTRQLHDGSVLTAAHSNYRVQFDRRELGVERVRDVDIMPAEPADNLPPALLAARPRMVLNGRHVVNGQPVRRPAPRAPPAGAAAAAAAGASALAARAAVPDPQAMSELAVELDQKEVLLAQLRAMNEEAAAGVHADGAAGQSAAFTQAYAGVVLKLKEVNARVEAKLAELQRGPAPVGEVAAAAAAVDGGNLPEQLLAAPITADALADSALAQAREILGGCRAQLAAARASAAEGAAEGAAEAPPPAMDWDSDAGRRLGGVIEGAIWSLVLLHQGADKLVPVPALAAALDRAVAAIAPAAPANAGLYEQVRGAVEQLKVLLLA